MTPSFYIGIIKNMYFKIISVYNAMKLRGKDLDVFIFCKAFFQWWCSMSLAITVGYEKNYMISPACSFSAFGWGHCRLFCF